MNFLENCLLLLGLPTGMILAGYWASTRLTGASAAERLSMAALMGLALLLWNIATVNFFKPLSGVWAWMCLWPIAVTVLYPRARTQLRQDIAAIAFTKRGAIALTLIATFVGVLLWPLLTQSALVFYDGTSNHDAFFWIASSEHLKRHSYMELPLTSALHPLTNATPAIIGWKPIWGRMGAEGLLALTSSIVGLAPVKLYLAATATLLVPWIAAVYLAVRTFWNASLGNIALYSLIALQPVFVFFHGNSNLPNLIGALMAAAAVLATEKILRSGSGRAAWILLLALAVHGLICAYPEVLPFAVMPAGLLWCRHWVARGFRTGWRPATIVAGAWIAGLAVNPASSARAWFGFVASFLTARANENWANLFDSLSWYEYVPALATLSVGTAKGLDPFLGVLASLALLFGFVLAVRRASDRIGALFTLAGSGALLAYTLYTGFNYGWQKTVQFGGAFWAAALPVAVVHALGHFSPASRVARLVSRASLAGVLFLFGYATIDNCLDGHKWSERKIITQEWFSLRDYARANLTSAPVLVETSSFRMAFFFGMWATYFLHDSDLYYAGRGDETAGYLRQSIIQEGKGAVPPPSAYLVSRAWADTFDSNSEPLLTGDTFVLLKNANRVTRVAGLHPENGPPENAYASIKLDLRPHSRSELVMELSPRYTPDAGAQRWKIIRHLENFPPYTADVAGAPPWKIRVPLEANQLNRIELVADPLPPEMSLPPFTVHNISVQSLRD